MEPIKTEKVPFDASSCEETSEAPSTSQPSGDVVYIAASRAGAQDGLYTINLSAGGPPDAVALNHGRPSWDILRVLQTFTTVNGRALLARIEADLAPWQMYPKWYVGWPFGHLVYYINVQRAAVEESHVAVGAALADMQALRDAGTGYTFGMSKEQQSMLEADAPTEGLRRGRQGPRGPYKKSTLLIPTEVARGVIEAAFAGLPCGEPVYMADLTVRVRQQMPDRVGFRARAWRPLIETIGGELGYDVRLRRPDGM